MLKKYTFWLKTTIVFQVLTAAGHSLSFLVSPVPENDTEKQLIDLMNTYQMNMGNGFSPTMANILTSLSACMPALYIFGALINWYLLRRKVDITTLKGVVNISLLIFGAYFVVTAALTFLPPITLTGLVFVCLVVTRLTFPKA